MLSTLLCVSAVLCYSRYNVTDNVTCGNGSTAPTLSDAIKIANKLNGTPISFILREKYLNKSLRFVVSNYHKRYKMYVLEHAKPKYLYCTMAHSPSSSSSSSSSSISPLTIIGIIILTCCCCCCCIGLGITVWMIVINYEVIRSSSSSSSSNANNNNVRVVGKR